MILNKEPTIKLVQRFHDEDSEEKEQESGLFTDDSLDDDDEELEGEDSGELLSDVSSELLS